MRVVERFNIKRLGVVCVINDLPAGLQVGTKLTAGVLSWTVKGIETHAMHRRYTNGKPAGLIFQEDPPPEVGTDLELSPPG